MLYRAVRQQLQRVDLLRYRVAPALRGLRLAWQRMRAERARFTYAHDLKALAAERGWRYAAAAPSSVQQTMPSKTIPEDARQLLRQGPAWARRHDQHGRKGSGAVEQLWFANLAAVTRYPLDETFTCEVPAVAIQAPSGAVVTRDFAALVQSSRLDWSQVMMARVPSGPPISGLTLSLLGWSVQNYSHWLVDILPRTMLAPERLGELRLLVPAELKRYHRESLELLGVAPDRLVQLTPGWHRLERILLSHAAQRYMLPKRAHVTALRDRLWQAALGPGERPAPWRRVYVSRARTRRRVLNEDELLPILREYEFEVVCCEELSLREQIRLFAEASVILGAHGSGLNNSLFVPPGGKLLELYNPLRWNYCVRNVANLLGHEHWYLFGAPAGPDFDLRVEPQKLAKLLAYAFERDSVLESSY
jgi:capsular polysaccharide biosynthesis protein